MTPFLSLSRLIDTISTVVGKLTMWLILATTLISAGNALVRKAFNQSSNSLLEIQWYLFAAVFLLGAGYGFLKNSHVRIDFISSKLSDRGRNWVDVIGILVVLIPFCVISIALGWPFFLQAYTSGEISTNAGGLIRWPVYGLCVADDAGRFGVDQTHCFFDRQRPGCAEQRGFQVRRAKAPGRT